MPAESEREAQDDRDRGFLAGELIGWIVDGVWAGISGLVTAVTE